MHVADRLHQSITQSGSLACVGADPRPSLLPPILKQRYAKSSADREAVAKAFLDFNRNILDAIAGRCACSEAQSACYEAYGHFGVACLEATIAHANDLGVPVILDGKRNDIGSTAAHYRQLYQGGAPDLLGEPCATPKSDWLTANAYLGYDGIGPLLGGQPGGGVFVLVKTSNPGSAELQGKTAEGGTVMDIMADLVRDWGGERLGACGLSDIGAVVGATYPGKPRPCVNVCQTAYFWCLVMVRREGGWQMPSPACEVMVKASWSTRVEGSMALGKKPSMEHGRMMIGVLRPVMPLIS